MAELLLSMLETVGSMICFLLLLLSFVTLVAFTSAAIGGIIYLGTPSGEAMAVGFGLNIAFCIIMLFVEMVRAEMGWTFLHGCLVVMGRAYVEGSVTAAVLSAIYTFFRRLGTCLSDREPRYVIHTVLSEVLTEINCSEPAVEYAPLQTINPNASSDHSPDKATSEPAAKEQVEEAV